jgi:hypothetical protein
MVFLIHELFTVLEHVEWYHCRCRTSIFTVENTEMKSLSLCHVQSSLCCLHEKPSCCIFQPLSVSWINHLQQSFKCANVIYMTVRVRMRINTYHTLFSWKCNPHVCQVSQHFYLSYSFVVWKDEAINIETSISLCSCVAVRLFLYLN